MYLRSVVSLSKTLYSPKVLVIPRKQWLCPDMPEKLLTGTLNLNTNKHKRANFENEVRHKGCQLNLEMMKHCHNICRARVWHSVVEPWSS